MVVFLRQCAGRNHTQTAAHAKVKEQIAAAAVEQKIFCAPRDGCDLSAAHVPGNIVRHGPAQMRVAHDEIANLRADHEVFQPASRRFYFGKFWHAVLLIENVRSKRAWLVAVPANTLGPRPGARGAVAGLVNTWKYT